MKLILPILLLMVYGFDLRAGALVMPDSLSPQWHLDKARKQRQSATSLVVIGSTLIVTGLVIGTSSLADNILDPEVKKINASAWMILGGLAMDIASIPLFVSASNHKRRGEAANGHLSLGMPRPFDACPAGLAQGTSLKLHVRF